MTFQEVVNNGFPLLPFPLTSVNCQVFFGLIVEWFPVAISTVLNSDFSFSSTGCHTKRENPSLLLLLVQGCVGGVQDM